MPTRRVLGVQWRDYTDAVRYPFADSATLVNDEGLFFPESTFLDAVFYPPGAASGFYLSAIIVKPDRTCTIALGDQRSDVIASATVPIPLPSGENSIRFVDAYYREVGLVVTDRERTNFLSSWPEGEHRFRSSQTEFAASCCIPVPPSGVDGLLLDDGTLLTGDVWLVGEDGVVLSHETVVEERPSIYGGQMTLEKILIHVVGDPLFKRRRNLQEVLNTMFLKTLSVAVVGKWITCGPDAMGNIQLYNDPRQEGAILRLRPGDGGLIIEAVGYEES